MSQHNRNSLKNFKKIYTLPVLLSIIVGIFLIAKLDFAIIGFQEETHIILESTIILISVIFTVSSMYQYRQKEKSLQKLNESKKALDEACIIANTDADGKITFVNDKFVKISKYSKEELLGKNHNLLKSGYHSRKFYRNMWRIITSGKIWRGEIKNKAKDGTYYWVKTTIIPLYDSEKKISGYTSIRTDITEQKKQQETLTRIDKKKDEFISMISHELKTPLSPIISWSGMLQEGVLGDITEKQKYGVSKIQENSNELLELIHDILDVHKLELGKINFKVSRFNIKHLLTNIIEDYKVKYMAKYSFLLESEDIIINSDNSRIVQVVRNFVNNALDFLPEEKPKIILYAKNENDYVVISVKDNGTGISKKNQKALFKKFYQVDTSATREHGGTGLGLSICMGIAEGLKGKIGVTSEENKGSEFFIKIPKNSSIELTN